ncbi:IS1182 family transposase [Oxalobacter vibrioformis]|uniref:IS1182 family transposase n=1 Tax=Oxalobacter vibrioformis TaxID=933080 RepID=A0A9E9P2Z4_9BURK|nr:IS1182 family transposase [Oxalobacter vibrioformis]WAW09706.1 IS1182 family transposase [Oxalobacter vibrioformis]WAW10354.1 IS1182 family transposase [Oxalobacter vibrioformis]WAW10452.1 IS1182 family transposase [Oxalobacter vibrioformis]
MLKTPTPQQHELEMVTLEELVPKDHLLRLIDRHIHFDFIREHTAHLYSADNGRPALDPVVLFKMLFIGYLFGIRSERQIEREIQVNVAYRWFLGLRLTDRVPDASTLSQNRRRRFAGTDIEQVIFDEIVEQCIRHGLIGGRVFYSDSTHLKASANKNRHERHLVEQKPVAYLAELNSAIEADRYSHGKNPLSDRDDEPPSQKEIKVSPADPDAGYLVRDGKPKGFYYLDHRTVDGKYALITDTHVTPGNVHDSVPYLKRLDRMQSRFGFEIQAVGLDAGYDTPHIAKGLIERGIYGVIGYRRPNHKAGYFYKRQYSYDPQGDCYLCPNGKLLPYRTTNRSGYREYASQQGQCTDCAFLMQCTQSRNQIKLITRHIWQGFKEQVHDNRLTAKGKAIYRRRQETVERSFADAKELHGHRYARYRGLSKVKGQALLAAACQNMKKMARLLEAASLAFLRHFPGRFGLVIGIFRPRGLNGKCDCYFNFVLISR